MIIYTLRFLSCILLFLLSFTYVQAETFIEDYLISEDTVWVKENSPYVLQSTLLVDENATLTITPGTIIKFDIGNAGLIVSGGLIADGTSNDPIHFTSYYDDLGGDTNGDGSETLPEDVVNLSPWSIYIDSQKQKVSFNNVLFKYSNGEIIIDTPQHITVENIEMHKFGSGIITLQGSVSVLQSYMRDIKEDAFLFFEDSSGNISASEVKDILNGNGVVNLFDLSKVKIKNLIAENIKGNGLMGVYGDSELTMEGGNFENIDGNDAIGVYNDAIVNIYGTLVDSTRSYPALALYGNGSVNLSDSILSNGDSDGVVVYADSNNALNISSTTIENYNGSGIKVYGSGGVSITESDIINNLVSGIYNTNGIVTAINNWWGDETGPYDEEFNPEGIGNQIIGEVEFKPWLENERGEEVINPVIIIPGFLGSAQKNGVWLIDPIFHVYDNLIETLAKNGFIPGELLFTFPYDWRQSNVVAAQKIKSRINEIKEICKCNKVDIIAHSMGGLVAREYIQSDKYTKDVDNLIFLGTPHLGAPKAYLTWEAGESAPQLDEQMLQFLLEQEGKELGYKTLFDYVKDKPLTSVQELLPIYDYLKEGGVQRIYPSNYPQNQFLEKLNISSTTLLTSGVNITNIVGSISSSTIEKINVIPSTTQPLWEHGYVENFFAEDTLDVGLVYGVGDRTVPEESGEYIKNNLIKTEYSHLDLVTEAQDKIYSVLTNRDLEEVVDRFRIPNTILLIQMFSPADMYVVAPDGKKVGKNILSSGEFNEISGAYYSGELGNEFITIPDPQEGEYKILVEGVDGGGEYTIKSLIISKDTTQQNEFTSTIKDNQVEELNLEYTENNGGEINKEKPTIRSVINYIKALHNLGVIKDIKLKNSLIKSLEQIEKQLNKNRKNNFPESILLKNIFQTVEKKWKSKLPFKEYEELKNKINSLINI